jgi:hypothetical protein
MKRDEHQRTGKHIVDPKDTAMLRGLAKLWRLQARTLAAMRVALTHGSRDFDFYELPDDDELLYDELLDAPSGEDVPMTYFVAGSS